jgi:Protein of unknown function (DUF3040)
MVDVGKEVAVLSDHEQRVWDDIERFWAEDAEEPSQPRRPTPEQPNRPPRDPADHPAWAVTAAWLPILLVVFGAPVAGLGVGAATVLGWVLWRCWRS